MPRCLVFFALTTSRMACIPASRGRVFLGRVGTGAGIGEVDQGRFALEVLLVLNRHPSRLLCPS